MPQGIVTGLSNEEKEVRMFVLSVEGESQLDKGTWSTHRVLGVFGSHEEAVDAIPAKIKEDLVYNIVIITNVAAGTAVRIES